MQLVSNTNIVFNSPKADYSRSILLATPHVAEPLSHLTALLIAYSTRSFASYTLRFASSTVASSQRQYPAPCDGRGYYHWDSWTKILSEVALELR
jgi:hypothetical protein